MTWNVHLASNLCLNEQLLNWTFESYANWIFLNKKVKIWLLALNNKRKCVGLSTPPTLMTARWMNLIILQSVTRVYFSTGFLGGLSNDPRPDIDLFFSSFLFGFGEKRLNGGPPSRHIKWRRKHRYDGCLMRSIDFSINFKWSRLVLNTKRCLISKLEPFKSPAGRELRASSVSSTLISSFNSIFCAHHSTV